MNDDDLENGLRRVLGDPSRRLPDTLVPLDSVYAGASRRRARRSAMTAVAATSVAVLVVAGFSTWHVIQGNSPQPSNAAAGQSSLPASVAVGATVPTPSASAPSPTQASTKPSAARPLVPAGFSPVSVTAISPNHWWVLGSDGVIATTLNGGQTFSSVGDQLGAQAKELRFASATQGWAINAAQGLRETADGGSSWTAVRLDGDVTAVEAGGGSVFALTKRTNGTWAVWTSVIGKNTWHAVASLGTLVQPPLLAVQAGHAVVAAWDTSGFRTWIVAPGASPVSYSGPCTQATGADDLSATTGGVWLVCIDGMADSLWQSVDATSWSQVSVPAPATRMKVGAITVDRAAVGRQDGTIDIVSTDGTSVPAKAGLRDGQWTYLAFTNKSDGFALGDHGDLLRSTDGGRTWSEVSFS
jgi:photosystem II stability/assembly factor-like uncharacterized protein